MTQYWWILVWQYANQSTKPTTKLKSAKISTMCMYMYVWHYCTILPNLNPPILFNTSFGAKPPYLMNANISCCTVLISVAGCYLALLIFFKTMVWQAVDEEALIGLAGSSSGTISNCKVMTSYFNNELTL